MTSTNDLSPPSLFLSPYSVPSSLSHCWEFSSTFFSLQSHNAAAAVVVLVAGEVANSILWSVLLY